MPPKNKIPKKTNKEHTPRRRTCSKTRDDELEYTDDPEKIGNKRKDKKGDKPKDNTDKDNKKPDKEVEEINDDNKSEEGEEPVPNEEEEPEPDNREIVRNENSLLHCVPYWKASDHVMPL